MRTNRRPIAIMRRSCSDSLLTASQSDGVFGSDTAWLYGYDVDPTVSCDNGNTFRARAPPLERIIPAAAQVHVALSRYYSDKLTPATTTPCNCRPGTARS